MKIHDLVTATLLTLPVAASCSSDNKAQNSTNPTGSNSTAGNSDTGTASSQSATSFGATSHTGTSTAPTSSSNTSTGTAAMTSGGENTGSSGGSDGSSTRDDTTSGTSSRDSDSSGSSDTNGTTGSTSSDSDATSSSDSRPSVPDPPPLQNGQDGHATHYWDCCKPSCAWPDQGSANSCTLENQSQGNRDEQSGCFGGNAYQCWSMAPWAVSDTLAYGFAAFNAGSCGTCYQLEFTGTSSAGYDDPGAASIAHKIMIVQTVNRGGIAGSQFDLLVPGGGVGDFDACSRQWNAQGDLGERYGGFFLECRKQNGDHGAIKQCARTKCESMFSEGSEADLLAGCLFWVDWANVADNPNFKYGQVACPADISAVSGM
jgi:hypothetical protein